MTITTKTRVCDICKKPSPWGPWGAGTYVHLQDNRPSTPIDLCQSCVPLIENYLKAVKSVWKLGVSVPA